MNEQLSPTCLRLLKELADVAPAPVTIHSDDAGPLTRIENMGLATSTATKLRSGRYYHATLTDKGRAFIAANGPTLAKCAEPQNAEDWLVETLQRRGA